MPTRCSASTVGASVSTNRLFSLQSSSSIDASGTGAVNFTNTGAMGFNGGTVVRPDFSPITQHLLPAAVAARAIELLTANGVQVWVFAGKDWLLRDPAGARAMGEKGRAWVERDWTWDQAAAKLQALIDA